MNLVLDFPQGNLFFNNSNPQSFALHSLKIAQHKTCFHPRNRTACKKKRSSALVDQTEHSLVEKELSQGGAIQKSCHGQIRCDDCTSRNEEHQSSPLNSFSTIKYLYEAGAKVVLVGSWNENNNSRFDSEACPSTESVAGERANCSKFAKELASGVDIIVNDAFSESHKVLASTVGVASFCYAYIAGFYFEEGLYKLQKIIKTIERPYMAIIGGGNLADKAAALRFLASTCDGLIFVGSMAFQIMHALGVPVPMKLVELGALKEAVSIVESAKSRNIPLVLPKDIWCIKDHIPEQMQIFSVYSIIEGWQPVDIGSRSLEEMIYCFQNARFSSSKQDKGGTFKLAEALGTLSSCNLTFVGKMEFEELLRKSKSFSNDSFFKSAAVVWEVLKGRKLPGLMALDRAYPFLVDWSVAYGDPMRPLVVDVGSGNGLFLFGMARRRKDMNFLGLEINAKLVDRCLDDSRLGIHNVHFITTNATSTFRSIVSSYPGELVLVSIQQPYMLSYLTGFFLMSVSEPDFNKPEYRWRMLQRSLVEAIADMLMFGGKVFLQSDIKAVAVRMKNEFIEYGKGKLVVVEHSEDVGDNKLGWLKENPFGVPSDWEKHVLDRGDPMYRLLLSKVESRV
ncbi:hypothetical protein Pfo_028564 [Paulownia fortunei]|nr:hypothetical protein Pfo_028564 [Paulownia fortunei]